MSPRIEGRIAATVDRLSERDKLVLSLILRFRLLTALQLQALCFEPGQERLRRRVLARLVALGVLESLERRVGGVRAGSSGFVYQLGIDGQRALSILAERDGGEPIRRLREPGQRFAAHTLALGDVYVRLMAAHAEGRLHLERFDTEPEAWRGFVGLGGGSRVLKPDALIVTVRGEWEHHYFIEADMSTEGPAALTRKLRLYLDYWQTGAEQASSGTFPLVLWLTNTDRQAARIEELVAGLTGEQGRLFRVALLGSEVSEIEDVESTTGVA